MPKRRRFRHPYNSARTDHGMLPQLVGLGALSEYLFEGKEVMEMTAKKQDESEVQGTVMFLTQEQLEKAVANYMRSTMFKPEFKVAIISVIPADEGYRVEFCDPALLKAAEPPTIVD